MRAIVTLTNFAFITGLFIGSVLLPRSAIAQVVPDGTLPTIVTSIGNSFTIDGGTRSGTNLFHSFSQFSVPTGGAAIFNNAIDIQNIFSRITGGAVSNIDGLIQANGNANLFLLNPSGILFGPNASLNIGGSFIGTTANGIQFADGVEFSAVNLNGSPLLTMSVPIGLQMGQNSGSIQVQGNGNDGIVPTNNLGIISAPGKTIALVGNDVSFSKGVITAPAGRIEVGAVHSGTVSLTPTIAGWQLGYAQAQDWGDVHFSARSALWNPDPIGNPLGGIQVVGRDITLNQSQIAGAIFGPGTGGNISVTAQRSLSLGGVHPNAKAPSAWIVNQVAPGTKGNGGAVTIKAGQLTLQDGAAIETLSLGTGAAGKVQVTADTIVARGAVALQSPLAPSGSSSSSIISQTYASGAGGDVTVVARQLKLEDSAFVGTTVFPGATGRGGDILVEVADEIDSTGISPISLTNSGINAYTFGIGNSGNVRVSTGTLNLVEGGTIFTFTSRLAGIPGTGIGNAGDISVMARQAVNIMGTPLLSSALSAFIGSTTTGSGNSGNLSLTAPILSLQAGAQLGTVTLPRLGNFGDASQANHLGNSGNVTLNVSDRVTISGINPATLAPTGVGTGTYGNGHTGEVMLHTNQLLILDGGAIVNSTTAIGNAGALSIQANDILIEGHNVHASTIGASAPILNEITRQFYNLPNIPTGNTGVLNVNTHQLTVRNGGSISVTHEGTGNAGQLTIQADQAFLQAGSVNASTALGKGGNIQITLRDALVIRHGGKITAEAGGTGDGGNIMITAPIILGLENSDIIANAFTGRGGNIQITTQGILGLKFRSQLTPDNDITASSEFGVNGTVDVITPGIDPTSGLVALPVDLVNANQQVAQNCGAQPGSSFVISGRGGMVENPINQFSLHRPWADLRSLTPDRHPITATPSALLPAPPLVEAVGWRRNHDGQMELFAAAQPTTVPTALPVNCAGGRE